MIGLHSSAQQPGIDEVNFLPKTVSHKNGGQALSKNW